MEKIVVQIYAYVSSHEALQKRFNFYRIIYCIRFDVKGYSCKRRCGKKPFMRVATIDDGRSATKSDGG
ncbi:MAG TPA: hypothetical protein PK175_02655, partial [Syntrophales bacterium]|nr:hypothetical protein [Syntrophales bacterium]HPC32077.1 hypothetical protein [Syntrophales bacterium]HQG33756.1 hypothetical protein [Syntrophales bacterium]HQI35669.1 hypothetical protein [Syntrophales bacterium]HRR46763.1 hypothetical protein [Syntrophales bacterium]